MADKSKIFLGTSTDLDELRRTVEFSLNRLVTQINADKIDKDFDARNHRVINVAWPTELHDAVNMEFISDLFGRMSRIRSSAGGGGSGGPYEIHWGLGVGGTPVVSNYVAPPRIITKACSPQIIYIAANIPPVGADFIVDILDDSDASIFGATKLVLPDGASSRQVYSYTSIFASPLPVFAPGDVVSINVTQVGSSTTGRGIGITMLMGLI
jgi:hypothetical protein